MQPNDDWIFLNERGSLKGIGAWNDSEYSKLWLYNLHYFDDVNASGAAERRTAHVALVDRWIKENPRGHGNGWEPYPISLRIVNWVKWWSSDLSDAPDAWMASLADQTHALTKRLEYHILGNHLFANGKALVFAGMFFQGSQADVWLKKGLQILDREVTEQFLPDGGHFELSPMYHATLLWDVCDLLNLAQVIDSPELDARKQAWQKVIELGLDWLQVMSHPDGEIAFFNDAAIGISPNFVQLWAYATALGIVTGPASRVTDMQRSQARHLPESGYCRVDMPDHCVALLDLARVGPDYLPGHAHADTLSFELSLFGRRVLVNSGTSCYGNDVERSRQRSTAAHNTVVVNGQNSSEVWAGFRVARRAYPIGVGVLKSSEAVRIDACHNGYQRLIGRNVHCRCWIFDATGFTIEDVVQGPFTDAVAYFHLHPEVCVDATQIQERQVVLQLQSGRRVKFSVEGGNLKIIAGSWHPQFGTTVPNFCLVVDFEKTSIKTMIQWGGQV
ncbi:MAG: alginate lyase family protein [Burkholderiaceae bacterium]